MIGKAETLNKIKDAESTVRSERDRAKEQALAIVRDARAQAEAIVVQAREDAEAAYAAGLVEARKAVSLDRQATLKTGKVEADKIDARGKGKEFDVAVNTLVEKFKATASKGD